MLQLNVQRAADIPTTFSVENDAHPIILQDNNKISVKAQDVRKVKEYLSLMDPFFKTRLNVVFHKASDVESIHQILSDRKVHPEDVHQIVMLSEKMKLLCSTVIFIILTICNEPINE